MQFSRNRDGGWKMCVLKMRLFGSAKAWISCGEPFDQLQLASFNRIEHDLQHCTFRISHTRRKS